MNEEFLRKIFNVWIEFGYLIIPLYWPLKIYIIGPKIVENNAIKLYSKFKNLIVEFDVKIKDSQSDKLMQKISISIISCLLKNGGLFNNSDIIFPNTNILYFNFEDYCSKT